MEYKCIINNKNIVLSGKEDERLRDVLYRNGYNSVRDSDDREGFAGSDTIIFNGKLKYSNLILLYHEALAHKYHFDLRFRKSNYTERNCFLPN